MSCSCVPSNRLNNTTMACNLKMLAPVFALILCSLAGSAYSKCDVLPAFWCDDFDTAQRCGVVEQCFAELTSTRMEGITRDSGSNLVQFSLYYESLCPFCKQLISQKLAPAYEKIGSIMNLTLVPYGWAQETKVGDNYTFTCQHGADECVGNLIETCTINLVNDIADYFPFITCLEASEEVPLKAVPGCSKKFPKVPVDKIMACSKSQQGAKMLHNMGLIFHAVKPRPLGVPWCSVNGDHSNDINMKIQKDLIKVVCDAYKGSPKPAACSQ